MTLENKEFGQLSTKEVEIAKYLDLLQGIRLPRDEDDVVSFEQIFDISNVDHLIDSVKNKQDIPTPLCTHSLPSLIQLI